jgi:hypothetical protein
MSDTNKYLLTIDDIFRMQGRQPGFVPSDFEYEQAQKTINDLNKSKLESMMSPEKSMPQYVTLTNKADNSEVRGIMEGGKFRDIPVDKINTQQGMYAMSNPTNAAPIVDPRTGQQVRGYAADPDYGSAAPAPMAGGGAFAGTNAPTASPSPTPYPEGAKIRNKRDGMLYQVVNGVPQLIPGQ